MTDLTRGGDDFNRTLSLHPSHLQSFMGRRAVHFQYFQGKICQEGCEVRETIQRKKFGIVENVPLNLNWEICYILSLNLFFRTYWKV